MPQLIEANGLAFGLALLAVLLVGWLLLRRASKAPARREHRPDVLDKGVGPAQRNQALIDAAPAAQIITPPPLSGAMGGLGEAIAVGAQDVVEEAEAAAPPSPPPPPPAPVEVPLPESAVAPEPEPEPEPVPEIIPEPALAPEPPVAEASGADDLSRIKGLGPKLQALLPTLGFTTYAQIAALDEAGLAALDGQLGPFAGRPVKDSWVEQARFLASGDVAGFEEKFGKV